MSSKITSIDNASMTAKVTQAVRALDTQPTVKGLVMIIEDEEEGFIFGSSRAGYGLVGALDRLKLDILNTIYKER